MQQQQQQQQQQHPNMQQQQPGQMPQMVRIASGGSRSSDRFLMCVNDPLAPLGVCSSKQIR